MNALTKAVDSLGNFRECLTDPHDFDLAMAELRKQLASDSPMIVVVGSPAEGFRFIGPFLDQNDAHEQMSFEADVAWLVSLEAPDDRPDPVSLPDRSGEPKYSSPSAYEPSVEGRS